MGWIPLAVFLICVPTISWSASSWYEVHQKDGTLSSSSTESARAGYSYRTTIDSDAVSNGLIVAGCQFQTVDAVNLTGSTVKPVKCNELTCANPVDIEATPLPDGSFWVLEYWLPVIKINDATDGDIVEIACGRNK